MDIKALAGLLCVPELPRHVERVERELERLLAETSPRLGGPALALLRSGGKRLRPTLVIAGAASGGQKIDDSVITAGAAIELIHLASLVHDDIIDDDKIRNGQPTVVAAEGLSAAILVGDYLIAEGLAQAASLSGEAANILASAIAVVCEGQARELDKRYSLSPTNNDYIETARKKAGALISAACRLGGLCANLPKIDIRALGSFGEDFGIAFQIIDDLSDQDFARAARIKVVSEAGRYCSRAAGALKRFDDNPVAAGLAGLPEFYLDWALLKIDRAMA